MPLPHAPVRSASAWVALLALVSACSPAPLSSSAAGSTPSAGPVSSAAGRSSAAPAPRPDPVVSVGPIFDHGVGQPHSCTASVLDTPGQDLILTAAHCVTGTGRGMLFVPGYARGAAPYGVWQVTAAYVDPAWIGAHEEDRDYAILRVAEQRRAGGPAGVQSRTGGNELGLAPVAGQRVTAIAYNQGLGDAPVRCETSVYDSDGHPTFDCPGFSDGTSGGPWLAVQPDTGRSVVRGVIGGLHQGGCHDYTSYSPAFSAAIFGLLDRAERGAPGDTVPAVGSDC
ncbi:MAG TPA: trypsin-like peptidase domain-containing protein [Jatrophihabitans sp.]|nr:trypsin-like peptidase domain-containing protein [Jatrophihabitans sp.]